jgi:Flp pilus assembly protein TadB
MVIVLLISYYYLKQRSKNLTLKFERDYPTFLLSLASAVKTGLDPLSAISHTTELLPNDGILTEELKNFLARINSSLSEEEAIFFFGQNINFPDLSLFRIALLLARGEGASITAALERLNRITRTRQSFRRKIRSSLAMQRMSSVGITFCSIGILFFQFTTNREAFLNSPEHPVGKIAFLIGGLLLIIGLISMNMIGRNLE